jgi:hypothetical protein
MAVAASTSYELTSTAIAGQNLQCVSGAVVSVHGGPFEGTRDDRGKDGKIFCGLKIC